MKPINRNDPCIHGEPGMCDDCYAGSKLKRRIEHMKTETKHTPTLNEMKARVIIIETGIKTINADLKKLERKWTVAIDPVQILEDYRFRICQERNRLNEAIAEAEEGR